MGVFVYWVSVDVFVHFVGEWGLASVPFVGYYNCVGVCFVSLVFVDTDHVVDEDVVDIVCPPNSADCHGCCHIARCLAHLWGGYSEALQDGNQSWAYPYLLRFQIVEVNNWELFLLLLFYEFNVKSCCNGMKQYKCI